MSNVVHVNFRAHTELALKSSLLHLRKERNRGYTSEHTWTMAFVDVASRIEPTRPGTLTHARECRRLQGGLDFREGAMVALRLPKGRGFLPGFRAGDVLIVDRKAAVFDTIEAAQFSAEAQFGTLADINAGFTSHLGAASPL